MEKFILASASPRRKELLAKIIAEYEVVPSTVDEDGILASTPAKLVEKLAIVKAESVATAYPNAVVIGCDTIVELGGKALGKPHNKQEAKEMLYMLSGNTHYVHTGVCVQKENKQTVFVETSEVTFAKLTENEIESYISTDEPYDKAGGYAIQGLAAKFITCIQGCYFNIMGLPIAHLYQVLTQSEYL